MPLLGLIGLGLSLLNPTEKLIDELLLIDDAYSISSLGFLALDPSSSASSAMVGLVRMGATALPTLFAHLGDARETKYVLKAGPFTSVWLWDHYDDRSFDSRQQNPLVNHFKQVFEQGTKFEEPPNRTYTVKVGDLCYVLIGQIVNRRLNVWEPGAINSVFYTPALAKAVRKDWEGLTIEQHRKQLEMDLPWRTDSAIQRLLYYYPAEGEKQALRYLNRGFYSRPEVWSYVLKLLETDDAGKWREIAKEAKGRLGPEELRLLPDILYYNDPERAGRIQRALFPSYKPDATRFYNLATPFQQAQLVDALKPFPSAKLDVAIQAMLRRAIAWHQSTKHYEPCGIDNLIWACTERKIKP